MLGWERIHLEEPSVIKIGKQLSVLGLVLLSSSLSFAIPFPYEDYAVDGYIVEKVGPVYDDEGSLAYGRGAENAASGDSVHLLCPTKIFSYGTYGGTDCWGWTSPTGVDYAIYGMQDGIAFVNTATMESVDIIPFTPFCGWRDMKTYQHYCYAVSECGGTPAGLMVMDLQFLPDSVHFITAVNITQGGQQSSHNLSIDTIKGFAYAEGFGNLNQAIQIFDLSNPELPVWVGNFGPAGSIHDMYVMNDTAYVAEGYSPSFSIWNVANKSNPQMIVRVTVPTFGYLHNIWPTDDGTHVVTTEETPFMTVKIWDIRNLGNIQMVGEYIAPGQVAHNAQIKGDKIYISHYESGVSIVDISNPTNPIELARYDTYTTSEQPEFNGCWGVYNYAADGLVYASNRDGRLFILEEIEAVLNDTLIIDTVAGTPGSQSRIDVYAVNSLDIRQFIVPFTWVGPYNMTLDSVSTVGLRTEYFEQQGFNSTDYGNKRVSYRLTTSLSGTSPLLPPGAGPIFSIYFSVPFGATGGPNPVNITSFNNKELKFIHPCLVYDPAHINGAVGFNLTCCDVPGDADNSGTVDISDVTYTVAYMFEGGPPPVCFGEGDLDANCAHDIADLTYRVDYMFNGGAPPADCVVCK